MKKVEIILSRRFGPIICYKSKSKIREKYTEEQKEEDLELLSNDDFSIDELIETFHQFIILKKKNKDTSG